MENGGWILRGDSYLLHLRELRWVGLPQFPEAFLQQPAVESLSFEKCLKQGGNGAGSPWQFSQRRWGGGIKGACHAHTVEISHQKKINGLLLCLPNASGSSWNGIFTAESKATLRGENVSLCNRLWHLHAFSLSGYSFVSFVLKKESIRNIIKGGWGTVVCFIWKLLFGTSEYFHGGAEKIK